MSEKRQQIAAKIIHLLLMQGGDCRADDYVEGDITVADLLDEYESSSTTERPLTKIDVE